MNKPEFEYVKGIFDIEVPTVICITNTIRFNPIKTIAYFDGICKNGVYKFTAKIGNIKTAQNLCQITSGGVSCVARANTTH